MTNNIPTNARTQEELALMTAHRELTQSTNGNYEITEELFEELEGQSQEEADAFYQGYLEGIAAKPHAIELMTATAPAVEGRTYADLLTPIEKAEADEMARNWIAKNGDIVSTEVLRVIKVLNDPKTDMPRAGRRVLRAYLDSLLDEKNAKQEGK